MDKEDVIDTHTHTHTHTLCLAIKSFFKRGIMPFATTWMGLEGITLNEMSGTEIQALCDLTYMWNIKKNSQKQQICGCQRLEAGFPDSSVGKESACDAGDPSLIPGLGRSAGEGIDYPLQYSWASLVAPLVKNPPAMWETCVRSLGWEDCLEKGKATHSSILAWRIPWTV